MTIEASELHHDKHTVLIVEDDLNLLRTLEQLCESEGYEVMLASDGQEAIELMELTIPCAVLTDIVMPKMDGLALCRHIRQQPGTRNVPVILLSGRTDKVDIKQGFEAGGSEYIKKPFDALDLKYRLKAQIMFHERYFAHKTISKQLSAIMQAAKDAIIMMDHKGHVVQWNKAAESIFGYSSSEALGQNLHEMIVPEPFLELHKKAFPAFQKTGEGSAMGKTRELVARRKNGKEFPVELSLSAVRFVDKWYSVGIVRDITGRKMAEMRFRALFESSRDAIMTLEPPTWNFTSANAATVEMFGAKDDAEIIACPPWRLSPEKQPDGRESGEAAKANIEKAMRDGSNFFHWDHMTLDGRVFPATVLLTRVDIGVEPFLQATVRDVSKEKQIETDLAHARKLEAVGQLAAGIAHEINTPTQFVSDSIQFLSEAYDDIKVLLEKYHLLVERIADELERPELLKEMEEAEEDADMEYLRENIPPSFERCVDGLKRIATIVSAMKEFAHPDQREKGQADLNQALQSTLIIAKNEYKYVADVETEFGELPVVKCHVSDLNQVFLNLLVNAAHAIGDVVGDSGDRGKIRIRTAAEDDCVRIEIEDTGTGIPESIQDRIFDPFFTTKEVGKGTGQGLAIAHSVVVDKHKGTLSVESKEGQGTTFVIRLPIDGDKDCKKGTQT